MEELTPQTIEAIYDQGKEAVLELVQLLSAQLRTQNQLLADQAVQLMTLSEKIQQLELKLALNSRNSSKPPSSDGPTNSPPPKPKSLRKSSGRTTGGQPGHKGTSLCWVEKPDRRCWYWPLVCQHCQADLSQVQNQSYELRQEFEIPPLKLEVIEHCAYARCCPNCQRVNQAAFPDYLTNWLQYGPKFKALAVYLVNYQLLPYERTCELLGELFGASVSEATLYSALESCYAKLAPVEITILEQLVAGAVSHNDETSTRLATERYWVHVTSNQEWTHYGLHRQRGKSALKEIGFLSRYEGVSVHDGLSSYHDDQFQCEHALCNAHHLRELTFIEEELGQNWAGEFKGLLIEIKAAVAQAQAEGRQALSESEQVGYELAYRKLLLEGLLANPPPPSSQNEGKRKRGRKKQSKAKNLLDRLHDYEQEVLRFMRDFRVPFDNNQAERDLRMLKVQQKISGGFRSEEGARFFCRIRGYISTVRKQGESALYALAMVFLGESFLPALAPK
jgi:transposase